MKTISIAILTCVTIITLGGFANAFGQEEKPIVAVIDLQALQGVSEPEALILSSRVLNELVKTGQYDVVERDKMMEILKEHEIQLSGVCNTTECYVRVGQVLGAEKIIAGTVGKIGVTFTLTLRMVNVETSKIEKVADGFCTTGRIDDVLLSTVPEVVQKLTGYEVGEEKVVRTEGDLYITSDPVGAEVLINNEPQKMLTPFILESLEPGEYEIVAKKGGYEGKQKIYLNAGEMKKVDLALERLTGSLKILSKPLEADVFVGGQSKGKTPLILKDLLAGEIELKLSKDGYADFLGKTRVIGKETTRFEVTLEKLYKKDIEKAWYQKPGNKKWLWIGGGTIAAGIITYAIIASQKEEEGTGSVSFVINIPD